VLTRTLCVVVAVALGAVALGAVACSQDSGSSSSAAQPPKAAPPAPTPPAAKPPPDATPPPDAAPPLPTDPKTLAELRKLAILDARYDVAVTICTAEDVAKLDEQSLMSCVLSACRQNDLEKAQAWGKLLKGPLKAQAKKICLASKIPI
jgi:hypothetical protein